MSSNPLSAFNRTRGTRLAASVRVADTHWSRLRGLIGTYASEFGSGYALWIVPCRGIHTFAMRFPLDVIYLDREGNVVHALEEVHPWRFTAVRMHATSVLELPAGTVYHTGTQAGDRIEIVSNKATEAQA